MGNGQGLQSQDTTRTMSTSQVSLEKDVKSTNGEQDADSGCGTEHSDTVDIKVNCETAEKRGNPDTVDVKYDKTGSSQGTESTIDASQTLLTQTQTKPNNQIMGDRRPETADSSNLLERRRQSLTSVNQNNSPVKAKISNAATEDDISDSSSTADSATEKLVDDEDIEKIRGVTSFKEKTDLTDGKVTADSLPSNLSPASVKLAASLFRFVSTVTAFVIKLDSDGGERRVAADVDIAFIEPLQEKHECPVCARVLRYPVQFECSHRCCSSCLPELLRVAPRCPKDNKPVDRESVTVDKAFQREIEGLGVKCANHSAGCKWKGVLKEFYPHYEDCKFLAIPCPRRCGAEFEKRFLDKHLKEDCPKRDMNCEFCKSTIPVDEEITHLNVCKRFPIPCPNGCKKKEIPREELDEHMESACTKQGIPCPFSECGCEFRCARKEMNKHIRDEPVKHLTLVGQTILAHKKTLEMHSEIMDSQNDKLEKSVRRVEGLEKLYGSQLIWKIDNYSAKLEEAKAGKKPTIFSPPFLTSRHGYKLAMSCCLYGDGKARGKNLSVFVCICKGEYDALLLWPFSHRVSFTLIDQCQDPEARRNVTYSVKPNTCKENKAFLGRPSGERNASFGAQKFCDLAVVDTLDYIRDDALFIKVNIEMDDMVML